MNIKNAINQSPRGIQGSQGISQCAINAPTPVKETIQNKLEVLDKRVEQLNLLLKELLTRLSPVLEQTEVDGSESPTPYQPTQLHAAIDGIESKVNTSTKAVTIILDRLYL